MAKYLIKVSYIGEGVPGLLKEGGSGRLKASERIIEALGGSIEAMYYAFGETDAFIIVDLPDNAGAVTASLMVNASGRVRVTYTPLFTPEEIDRAAERGRQIPAAYRAPGQ
ncbi:MAG: GYD domain-containing protein [Desulfobacterales bacterium]